MGKDRKKLIVGRNLRQKRSATHVADLFQKRYERELFLVILLGHGVGCAKADEESDTTAHRGGLVAGLAMRGQGGIKPNFSVRAFTLFATAEEAAIVGKRSHAQSEDDGQCQC